MLLEIAGLQLTSPPVLVIDGYKLEGPGITPTGIEFQKLRRYLRDIVPFTEEETRLITLDALFYGGQISAIEKYPTVSNTDFFDSLFTGEFAEVRLEFSEKVPEEIEVEEVYWDRLGKAEQERILQRWVDEEKEI